MKDLVRIVQALGYEGVRTYIQSGNVVFRSERRCSAREAGELSDAVETEFGFRPEVMLLEVSDLAQALERNPFVTEEGKFLHFYFLGSRPPAPDLDALHAVKTETERLRLDGRVFYLYTPDGYAPSKIRERVERCLGVSATARNLNTVRKLLEMAGESVSSASSR